MNQYLRYILPIYILIYFVFLLLIRMVSVGKQIGKSPVILPSTDDAHGLIARYFKLWMLLLCAYVVVYAVYPPSYRYLLPIEYMGSEGLSVCGLVILAISLIWTYAAQADMRSSWRVGIDTAQKTELVTTGIFGYSRNPIFAGMMASAAGLFLTTPNALLLLVVTGAILIQLQVRLEEEFLYKMHGEEYLYYKRSVRRFI